MGDSFNMTRLLNCFFILLWFSSPRLSDWHVARTFCQDQGGYLAEITSMSEFSLLEQYLLNYEITYWIGLNDKDEEGTWKWSESGVEATWTNWGPGEPNDSYGEDCVNMFKEKAHTWNDAPCEWEGAHGLCEV